MSGQQFRFDDGAVYERMMGIWSRLAGEQFLDWLAPASGLTWVDVGCGNGAFTQLLVERCAPAAIEAIDPVEGQIAYARARIPDPPARFQQGNAMALPFADRQFDAAVMALVIFFVPDPAKGVAEMVRVVKPGGWVSAYAWDIPGNGLPMGPIRAELRAMGLEPPLPPNQQVSSLKGLADLWTRAGLDAVETREIIVPRSFADFDDYWTTSILAPGLSTMIAALHKPTLEQLRHKVRARMQSGPDRKVQETSRANAVKGVVRR
ncbi:class I SAM-dependent methyltransferase [Enhydrobacter aerosaccus]|uniref:class I SAM-dependent methyltransferase n=1 Tax=Enhydrobacter aerosaccus TaxID=225324 RepID=UPI000A2F02BA|nr:class I SAM-dependent methyltransferase [Enhydrobacter aerosaccus]